MKFILSKRGLILLMAVIFMFYGLYDFHTTGITGGRTGRDYSRDESPFGYYIYMIFYVVGTLCVLFSYVYLCFNPDYFDKKGEQSDDESNT